MTDYCQCKITVVADDSVVCVDGEAHKVKTSFPATLHALSWDPDRKRARGICELKRGADYGFDRIDELRPYIDAWELEKAEADAAKEAREAKRKEQREAAEAEDRAARNEMQRRNAEYEAQEQDESQWVGAHLSLTHSDHVIIQEMEKFLHAEGKLTDDFVAERENIRGTARAEKHRLEAKGRKVV